MITTPSFTLTLNEQQRSAVENLTDSILLLAGAGTGKTGSLAARVAFLLGSSVKPEEILCLTFTNRACREMSQRVEATAGPAAQDVTIRTIHSFCAWLLRRAPESLRDFGRDFMVCDEEDALESIRAVVREISGYKISPGPMEVWGFYYKSIQPEATGKQSLRFFRLIGECTPADV